MATRGAIDDELTGSALGLANRHLRQRTQNLKRFSGMQRFCLVTTAKAAPVMSFPTHRRACLSLNNELVHSTSPCEGD